MDDDEIEREARARLPDPRTYPYEWTTVRRYDPVPVGPWPPEVPTSCRAVEIRFRRFHYTTPVDGALPETLDKSGMQWWVRWERVP